MMKGPISLAGRRVRDVLMLSFAWAGLKPAANAQGFTESARWVSPDARRTVIVRQEKALPNGPGTLPLAALEKGKALPVLESPLLDAPVMREFAGMWMAAGRGRWVENRFLIIEDQNEHHNDRRLCIIDAKDRLLLLNTHFEALERGPQPNVWAGIRHRGTGRHHSDLPDDFKDTLFVVDLAWMVKAAAVAGPGAPPYSHLRSLILPGFVLARPVWLNQPPLDSLVVGLWNGKTMEAITVNPENLKIADRKPLAITLDDKRVHSPWLEESTEGEVIRAMGILPPP